MGVQMFGNYVADMLALLAQALHAPSKRARREAARRFRELYG